MSVASEVITWERKSLKSITVRLCHCYARLPEDAWEAVGGAGKFFMSCAGCSVIFWTEAHASVGLLCPQNIWVNKNFVKSIYYLRHKLLSTYFLIRMSISVDSSPLLFWVLIHKLTQIWRFSVILMGAWGISFLGLPQNECLKQQELSVSQLCRFGVWIKVQMGSCSLRKLWGRMPASF